MTTSRTPRLRELSGLDQAMLAAAVVMATTVSVLGLLSSFSTLEHIARSWGFASPWIVPVGIDLAIPAFTFAGLLLIRLDMPIGWVPFFPRLLTGATVYLNWTSERALGGRITHSALVLLWVAFSEILGVVYANLAQLESGTRMERVRRTRWLLAPFSTVGMWRRMMLWEVTSYADALRLEESRLLARADLRDEYGRLWRWKISRRRRADLRMGRLRPAVVSTETTTTAAPVSVSLPSPRPAISAVSTETKTTVSAVSTETKTPVSARETKVSVSVSAPVSASETPHGDSRLRPTETETPQVSATEAAETPAVSVVPITGKREAINRMKQHLLSVSNPHAVSVRDAMDVLGIARSTAGKRLQDAKKELGISAETETDTTVDGDGDAQAASSSS